VRNNLLAKTQLGTHRVGRFASLQAGIFPKQTQRIINNNNVNKYVYLSGGGVTVAGTEQYFKN
jgi:hypothetical protein